MSEHLESVSLLALHFAGRFGAGKAARLAGLLHDLGKYNPDFQAYIRGAKLRVDHSTAGAATILQMAEGKDRIVADLLAYVIAGHHAGLPDREGEALSTLAERLKGFDPASLDTTWQSEISADATGLLPDFVRVLSDRNRMPFQLAFLGRMIFSCLVDADYKDTEAFYARIEDWQVDRSWPELPSILPDLIDRFDRYIAAMPKADTKVNRIRGEILAHVRSRASEAPGLFTLTVPTGGGKTLASLGFALDHAKSHGHRRIIYTIPFTAIIDQTATIFRDVLGSEIVLEHHSAIEEQFDPKEAREGKDKLKLAMEDWAAPVVVTTNVQFFESLFAARASRCRKLHNIANSVIILDEAQTLPRPLLIPAVWALRELAENYGCTIVLCTATQPALDARRFTLGHPLGLPLEGRELAPEPEVLAKVLARVHLHHAGDMDDEALIAALAQERQGLVIVNSRGHALALYRAAKEAGLEGLVHLTTRQYAAHRREILNSVRQRLENDLPCVLIATSLVEAGVDLDFPRVWRAEAGLDQIMQAAGRCNREGRRDRETSIVTIFSAPDTPPPNEIRGLCGDMQRIMNKHNDLLSLGAMEDFFGEVYWRFGKDRLDKEKIIADFCVGSGQTNFAYRTVAEKFRMIESGMEPVIVPFEHEARALVDNLAIENIPSGAIARGLQRYTVQVPPKARKRLIDCGHVTFAHPDKRGEQFAVLWTPSLYCREVGLLWEDAEYLGLEQWMV
ncbi:CRISPR-associated helicase Cas3' [Chelativorans sp. Marseille-P2723]|uniref:CRISPR-associated helicase Cas3' n=1 Tax=Chelativorans sp. Marseille-P2723 TaxID=2709133 RepID=UPI001FEF1674|nr:CRISPR-associated helicase Cas3' [Chelativorans sp. Marseille-P2723]